MASEKTDLTGACADKFVASVQAKIAALENLLTAYLAAKAAGALGQVTDATDLAMPSGSAASIAIDLPRNAFVNKSIPGCVELYLSTVGMKKKTNKEIADALKEGGVESNADRFDNIVTGALFKLKKAGKVLRFDDGWGWASNYPAHIRGAALTPVVTGKSTKQKAKKRTKTKASDVKATPQKRPTTQAAPAPMKIKGATGDRISQILRAKPDAEFSPAQIAKEMNLNVQVAHMVLAKLVKSGRANRTEDGSYKAIPTKPHVAHETIM